VEQVAQSSCGCPLPGSVQCLDGALSSLVWWKVSLPMAGGLELGDLYGPFQPKPFYAGQRPLEKLCGLYLSLYRLDLALAIFSARQLVFTEVPISLGCWDS